MLIIGGYYSNQTYSDCDAASIGGQHGLSLGQQNVENAQWYQFLPNLTTYEIPANVTAAIGGGYVDSSQTFHATDMAHSPTGGATRTSPAAGWATSDLAVYFTRTYSPEARTPTRYIPSSTAITTNSTAVASAQSNSSNAGAIAGGTVGGVIACVTIIGIVIWCLRRRKSNRLTRQPTFPQPQTPIAEKDGTSVAYPSPNTAKFSSQGSTPRPDTASTSWQTPHAPQELPQEMPPRRNWTPVPKYPGYPQQSMHSSQQTYFPPPPRPDQYAREEDVHLRAKLSSVRTPVAEEDPISRARFF